MFLPDWKTCQQLIVLLLCTCAHIYDTIHTYIYQFFNQSVVANEPTTTTKLIIMMIDTAFVAQVNWAIMLSFVVMIVVADIHQQTLFISIHNT